MPDTADRPPQSGVGHLGLSVTDLDRSIGFYCDVLGAILVQPPFPGFSPAFSGRQAIVMLGSMGVDLYEHDRNEGEEFDPARTGLDHVAFVASSLAELGSWAAWLDNQGVARSELRDASGFGTMFDFVDPDGIQLEVFFFDQATAASTSMGSPAA